MDLKSLSNKEFAYYCIQLLKEGGKLDERNLNILTNSDECHRLFSCSSNFSVLQEVPVGCSEDELIPCCYDSTGRQRYYKDIISSRGKGYVITNHWYGPNQSMPDNRSPFEEWVKKQIS